MDPLYMHRCLQLALLGNGYVAPNPMVGAVLVHQGRIIGEGYHRAYGQPHAEVNCMASVQKNDEPLLSASTLYVSLEPCAHYGKTPPCAKLIIEKKIPRVVVGCRDPFEQVNGKGIELLRTAGVEVTVGLLEAECRELNRRFFTVHTLHRPYIVLKWAQTRDRKIANDDYSRIRITNPKTNRLVHRWRSEEAAIAVGTNTALFDDPELTTRYWPGKHPLRVVVDPELRLPASLRAFHQEASSTIVFNHYRHSLPFTAGVDHVHQPGVHYYQVTADVSLVQQLVHGLYQLNVQSLLVEGGAKLLQSFLDEGLWDEARVITNEQLVAGTGLPAPDWNETVPESMSSIDGDTIRTYRNKTQGIS